MTRVLPTILIALSLLSCDVGPRQEFHGALYFGQGAYLMRFSLGDASLSIAGHLGDTTIRQVTALGDEDLLIAETASVNQRRVPRISWVDPGTGETADLYAGVRAEHLANPGVVVYDDGSDLYAVPQQFDSDNQIIFSHPQSQLIWLMEASSGILLIETGDADAAVIHSWDARTGELNTLEALAATCRLVGAVWIGPLGRLACKQRAVPLADAEYLLSDLEGKVDGRLNLPEDKEFLALAHIESQNALVLQETWRGLLGTRDKHAVWMHDLDSGESHRLAKNVNLGESVVYAEY